MKSITFAQAQRRYDAMEPPENPYDDLTEKPLEELEQILGSAEDSATDADVPRVVRRRCDEICLQVQWEIARRRRRESNQQHGGFGPPEQTVNRRSEAECEE